jgi:hypothetical protein
MASFLLGSPSRSGFAIPNGVGHSLASFFSAALSDSLAPTALDLLASAHRHSVWALPHIPV